MQWNSSWSPELAKVIISGSIAPPTLSIPSNIKGVCSIFFALGHKWLLMSTLNLSGGLEKVDTSAVGCMWMSLMVRGIGTRSRYCWWEVHRRQHWEALCMYLASSRCLWKLRVLRDLLRDLMACCMLLVQVLLSDSKTKGEAMGANTINRDCAHFRVIASLTLYLWRDNTPMAFIYASWKNIHTYENLLSRTSRFAPSLSRSWHISGLPFSAAIWI